MPLIKYVVSVSNGETISISKKRPATVGVLDMGGASAQIACKFIHLLIK